MLICGIGLAVLITIGACIMLYELKVQRQLNRYKDRDWTYDG